MRRAFAALLRPCWAAALAAQAAEPHGRDADAAAPKVLRYAFPIAETGFDPAQINDLYSRIVTSHIFDGLYHYDHLARPFQVDAEHGRRHAARSATTSGPGPSASSPGIYFADDPAFKGKQRELVAQDYVYSCKRLFDPRNKSPIYARFAEEGVIGLDALREEALEEQDAVRLRPRGRGPARARPLHAAVQAGEAAPALHLHDRARATCSARWRARWSRPTATRSWRTRWAPGRSGWRSGGAAR